MPYKNNHEGHEGHKDFLTEGNKGNEELKAFLRFLPYLLFKPVLVFGFVIFVILCGFASIALRLQLAAQLTRRMNGKLAARLRSPQAAYPTKLNQLGNRRRVVEDGSGAAVWSKSLRVGSMPKSL